MHHVVSAVVLGLMSLLVMPVLAQESASSSEPAPAIKPELIFAGHIGGKGDQAFVKVEIVGDKIRAYGPRDRYAVQLELNPDGSFHKVRAGGKWTYEHKGDFRGAHNYAKASAKKHGLSAGYKQVARLLQQPIFKVPGGTLYGWTKSQAQNSKGKWAPYMADSRGTLITPAPEEGYYFLAGTSDGGNSSFNTLPKDIDTMARMSAKLSTNYPNGKSTWCFVYNAEGKQLRTGFRLRHSLNDMVYDPWGRLILWGKGIANSEQTRHSLNVMTDGGSILMIDKEHTKHLFAMAIGSNIYGVAYDLETGIFAAVGYYDSDGWVTKKGEQREAKPFKQFNNSIQEKPGGGNDAVLVVWRMWEPRYSERRLKAIAKWKAKLEKESQKAQK